MMPEDINYYTQAQIEGLTDKGTKFLSAASQVPGIRGGLDLGGYTAAEHNLGWELVLELVGYKLSPATDNGVKQVRQREAVAQLDQWDGPNFERARASLDRGFPEQSAYVFDNLSAKSGPDSIGAVRTFLDRRAALRDGTDPARANTREQDKAAVELLASRRIVDDAEEQRLRKLIADATSLADMPVMAEPDPEKRQQTARKLDAWLRDWRESARVLIRRRDYQIRLGLAERRTSKGEAAPEPEVEIPTTGGMGTQ